MGRTPIDSDKMQIKKSRTTLRIEDPSPSQSESLSGIHLPEELITEILLRFPVKSLLKCKCVSKSWLSLISSKQFIRSHYSLSSSTQGEGQSSNQQLLITTMPPNSRIKGCFLDSSHVFDVEFPPLKPNEFPWIVGIVNGLVCLAIEENDLFICNPALRKSKHLASPNVGVPRDGRFFNYGFGYDESNDDYKIVCVQCLTGSGDGYETVVQVYSLMADSWRRIEDCKSGFRLDDPGTYANGKIHWTVLESNVSKIVTLDMVSEKYGEMQLPVSVDTVNWLFGASAGRLYVVCYYNQTNKMDLWVMNKYGDEESWSKVVSIPYVDVLDSKLPHFVCILRNGEIVLGNGSCLFVYRPKHKEFRKIESDGCNSDYDAIAYVESLVWPNELCL